MIPFDKREGKIWYNGDLVQWQDAKLHVISHGLHYASLVFEDLEFMKVKFLNYKNTQTDYFTQLKEWISQFLSLEKK